MNEEPKYEENENYVGSSNPKILRVRIEVKLSAVECKGKLLIFSSI